MCSLCDLLLSATFYWSFVVWSNILCHQVILEDIDTNDIVILENYPQVLICHRDSLQSEQSTHRCYQSIYYPVKDTEYYIPKTKCKNYLHYHKDNQGK